MSGDPVIVAVFNQKGGVGKTTTACNLAVCLAAHRFRVLLIDLDAQGNASTCFGVSPLPPIGAFDVLAGRAGLAQAMVPTAYGGLSLLPATESLRRADADLAAIATVPGLLRGLLASAPIDLVVIDCPPALGAVTGTALSSASAVLMPVRPDPYAHDGLVATWYEVKRIRERVNAGLGVAGILLTMTGSEASGDDVARVIRAEFGEQVYGLEIATDAMVAEAAQLALPVAVLDPDGLAGGAYAAATAELLRRLARQTRPGTALPPAAAAEDALNTLREWRASMHGALLRMPGRARPWTERGRETAEEPADDGDDAAAAMPGTGGVGPLAAGLAAGLCAGLLIEALTGVVGGVLRSLIR